MIILIEIEIKINQKYENRKQFLNLNKAVNKTVANVPDGET